ncbi:OLC1v1036772C1 [Oldenlandia corymbosa var. corymbosa]|uniref:OLC1v1036772C1 n=1 Tax=Oldenlandia corymbosa var. corymbosa TaxID=529605 RepID=A0AAV1CZE7_OLDCO|nr:OLC1v1036772C1 [Oldenlandia corymbosa var. corymbosa]
MRNNRQVVSASMPRSSSCRSTNSIIPANFMRSSSTSVPDPSGEFFDRSLVRKCGGGAVAVASSSSSPVSTFHRFNKTRGGYGLSSILKSFLTIISFPAILPTCRWLNITTTHLSITPSLGRKVTGTLFGNRRGHVSFAVQENPRSEPVSVIELAVTTATLVREMSSGLVRIALECEKGAPPSRGGRRPAKLVNEPMWTMYCNGKKCGYALSRAYTESDWHVLSMIQSVSVGAGVIPVVEDGRKSGSEGELLYMRAKFERVVGSRDSEAFYMMNPDGNGGPELSIFLLRI